MTKISHKIRWNRNRVLSFNKLWSFIVGARAIGKTFNCKKWAIDDFVKNGKRTAWVMRYKTEIDEITKDNKFFDDIAAFYPEFVFKIEGGSGMLKRLVAGVKESEIPWETFVRFKALSERSLKAISDPTVNKIIYDEFIPIPGVPYLRNEVERFLEYYFTISRDRAIRAVFLCNNVTTVSPYFSYFNVKMPPEGEFAVYDEIVIENCKNEPFKEAMRNTRFGKLVQGTNYAAYAIENNSLVDLNTFVMDRPQNARCVVRLDSAMGTLYLWTAQPNSIFISLKGDPNITTWALDEKSHNENSERMDFASSLATNLIKRHYRMGTMFFDSAEAKAIFMVVGMKLIQ